MAMRVDFYGPETNFIDDGLFDPVTGDFDPDIASATSTEIVLFNAATGWTVRLTGFGLPTNPEEGDLTGTVTQISFFFDGLEQARVSGMAWLLEDFAFAMDELAADNSEPFTELLDQQEIIYDSSSAVVGNPDMFLDELTQNNTLFGSDFSDTMAGGEGDDYIDPGANDGEDLIYGSGGDDTIDFSGSADYSYYSLDYSDLFWITATINAQANTGTIQKSGGGTDTLIEVARTQDYDAGTGDGLGIWGGDGSDIFNITTMDGSWFTLSGLRGADVYNIVFGDSGSTVRLSFSSGGAFTGAVVDLSTQTISNDGFGNSEGLTISGEAGRIELQGTNFGDSLTGSEYRDSFRGMGGNDTIDGGEGFDRVRYDRGEIAGLEVDLAAGTATGFWNGLAFTDSLSGIEQIRGSYAGDTLRGDGNDNYIEGRDGDDLIEGLDGDDTLYGDEGNDTLLGGAGSDRLHGDEGDDFLNAGTVAYGAGGDRVYGSSGDDTITYVDVLADGDWNALVYEDALSSGITAQIDAVANTGTVYKGSAGTDTLIDVTRATTYGDGWDLYGTEYDDTITYVAAENSWAGIHGGAGDDTYNLTLNSRVRLDFRGSWYDSATQGAVVNLATGVVQNDGFGDTDTVNIIAGDGSLEVRGTDFADSITGSGADFESFILRGGNDTLNGGGGEDMVRYDRSGSSTGIQANLTTGLITGAWDGVGFTHTVSNVEDIRGTDYADNIIGSGAANYIQGREGNDTISGEGGNDTLYGEEGNDLLYGRAQDDLIYGGSGNDTVDGGNGRDEVWLEDGNDLFIDNGQAGVAGQDTVYAGNGDDTIQGGNGNDAFYGGAGFDLIYSRLGNDVVYGGDQNDTVWAGAGNDTVDGGNGRDEVWLEDGDDLFLDNAQGGDAGRDTVYAGNGNDTIQGGNGNDAFYGGAGFDLIYGRLGNDLIYGGDQDDTIFAGDGNDTVDGGNGPDEVWLENGNDLFLDNAQGGVAGQDTVYAGNGDDTIQGGNGNDAFYGGAGADLIYGRLGNDVIYGGDQNDTIWAGAGNDTVNGGNGQDLVYLEDGNDSFTDTGQFDPYGADKVFGGNGSDTIAGNAGSDTLIGEGGNDLLFGGAQDDVLVGGSGSDTVYGGDGRDSAYLGDDNDIFYDSAQTGAFGADYIEGNAGNDTLRAGGGNDTLSGGAGSDRFVFIGQIEADTVTDYVLGEELGLDDALWGGGLSAAQVVSQFADDSGADVVFDFGSGNTITLVGLDSKVGLEADIFFL
ncbi:calcium-binding protein [Pseudooceanicola nanhaiensis]|uniref:calcium-binding protein n=1 Tax=Pseudooceanicola nanhaiensis TaxID=375761 RepID=UPI001CD64AB2|nr:calcium-binding protein [Pseudooceanicola nanhaiensis]MCA0922789.1 hypothetical protein [Pseudooceanicola nanhaiensis]